MPGSAAIGHVRYTSPSGGDLGNVVSYANFSIGNSGMQTLDLSEADYPVFTTGDASVTGNASYGIGRYGVRCFAPNTSGEYSAIGQIDLFNSGSPSTVRAMYMRWCINIGTAWAANNTFDAVKHCILLFGSPTSTRPMLYLDSRNGGLGIAPVNSVVISPAQGTNKRFCEDYPAFQVFDGNNRFDFYMDDGTATTVTDPSNSHVRPVLASTEWVCIEWLVDSRAATSPNGLIRMRCTRQDGTILSDIDESMPWDEDEAAVFEEAITMVDVLGGYYNNFSSSGSADNYIAIDRYVSFEANRTTFAGPPPGFLS